MLISKWNKTKRNKRRVISVKNNKMKLQFITGGSNSLPQQRHASPCRDRKNCVQGAKIDYLLKASACCTFNWLIRSKWSPVSHQSVYFLWNQTFNYRVHCKTSLGSAPSHTSSPHNLTRRFRTRFNIILSTALVSPKCPPFFKFFS
jgi:hypothetical protein